MAITLDQIVASVRQRVAARKQQCDLRDLREQADKHVPRGFRAALERAAGERIAVIAELKKASPSRGMIRGSFPVGMLAMQLERAGATCLSVLTEEDHFHGSLGNLREASAATNLPCLRKDFIVDEFQLLEARANRADAVLLIVAALEQEQLAQLYAKAREYRLDVLVEVHDEQELERAVSLGSDIIGVNSRNLKTLAVDAQTPLRLAEKLPRNVLRVAESGIASGADLRPLLAAGYQAFLIGEWLMRADDAGVALAQLMAGAKSPPLGATGVATWMAGTKD